MRQATAQHIVFRVSRIRLWGLNPANQGPGLASGSGLRIGVAARRYWIQDALYVDVQGKICTI